MTGQGKPTTEQRRIIKEAASLAGQPAAPAEDELLVRHFNHMMSLCADDRDEEHGCLECHSEAKCEAIRARLARPAVVSREWLRWQAGEIWSAKTIDDAVDTLADTLKGFGVEVDGAA